MKTIIRKPHKRHQNLLQRASTDIIRLEGNLNYTSFILLSGKKELMSYTLAMYSQMLPEGFIRVSKSCIVNKKYIKSLDQLEKKVIMTDKVELIVSRRRWNIVIQSYAA
ncbi:LytTR family DNA-binding domain-containing protein [Emticicia sp. W12TSBA100-4]|uniref:LytTR family DNA-binding domain-containing protein n=1 Tax=Emticicia sp. W12TSBA100-4 TaxID=3160965 RepID=UPI0033061B9F